MNTMDLLKAADELTDRIYKAMTHIETCEALIEKIKDKKIVFLDSDETSYISIDTVITYPQMDEVRDDIIKMLDDNKKISLDYLGAVTERGAIAPEEDEESKDLVDTKVEEVKEESQVNTEPKKQESKKKTEPKKKAESKKKEPLKAPVKTQLAIDVETVKKLYTCGTMNVRECADYLGVSYKVLYTFIQKHDLRKAKNLGEWNG